MRRAAVIASLLALACHDREEPRRRAPPPPPPPAPPATHAGCVAAAHGDLGSPGGTGLGPEVEARLRARREEVVIRLCEQDQWPADAARCYADAAGLLALGRCDLPAPASYHLTDELQALMRRELGLPAP